MPPAKLRFLAVPDFRAKGVAGARVAPMSVAAVQPGIDGKLSNARTLLLLDTAGKEFPSSGVSFREALETCVPSDAHPDPRDMAATENFMIEDEVDDLATAYDAAVVDADLLPLTLPPPSIRSNHDDVKSFLLSALEREDATAGTGLRIADLDLVEAPIVSRASVFDDDSTLAAPTGARLALELEKHFRGEGGWLPTNSPSPPPRSELFAPLNPRDRDRAARASAEREMRAPFDARVRRALAAVDRADFTPPTTANDDDEQLDPLRELPVPVILQDTHAPTLASSEPVELLAARMGFKQVSVPRVDLTWPPDAVAAAEAAFDGGEPEPVTQPAAPQPSPPAWNLADTTRVMAADDVHVRPPAHVGSVVAALDAADDAARALLERQERAADAIAEAADIEKAMRSDESFERASRELRVHSRAVLMGSGGGGGKEGDADVTFFIRPGGLRPDCARSPADFSAPPPIQSPTAREANRLCKLVESPLCDPPPSTRATRAGDGGYGGYGGSHPVIDLTTQRIDRDAGVTRFASLRRSPSRSSTTTTPRSSTRWITRRARPDRYIRLSLRSRTWTTSTIWRTLPFRFRIRERREGRRRGPLSTLDATWTSTREYPDPRGTPHLRRLDRLPTTPGGADGKIGTAWARAATKDLTVPGASYHRRTDRRSGTSAWTTNSTSP